MPYSVTTQDGYTLNGIPDELEPNSPQVLAEIEKLRVRNTAQQPPKTSAPRPYDIKEDDSNFVENILKGFGSGAAGMLESSALGIATLLEEEAELKARSKIKNIFDIDMLKGADQDSIAYKLSSGIGSIAALALLLYPWLVLLLVVLVLVKQVNVRVLTVLQNLNVI